MQKQRVKYLHPWLVLLCIASMLCGCIKDDVVRICEEGSHVEILHLSHTREAEGNQVMDAATGIDLDRFSLLLLGGDLTAFTSQSNQGMQNADNAFDIGNDHTHWALGNHDYGDPDLVSQYTNRPSHYVAQYGSICIAVLDTEKDQGSIVGAQKAMLENLVDTLSASTHLLVLHHKLIWLMDDGPLQATAESISNGPIGDCGYCLSPNNFHEDILPLLNQVEQKGIDVVCIGGDLGNQRTTYEENRDGIDYIGSGMNYDLSASENRLLILTYCPEDQTLDWRFASAQSLH